MSSVLVLYEGYSEMSSKEEMKANCSCTVITGQDNVIVDTMTAWDSEKILQALRKTHIEPSNMNYVVSTHGHSDHIGNNNLFLQAKHIVGFSISFKDKYFLHPFEKGMKYIINNTIDIVPTPGHTLSDVTVVVKTKEAETIAVTGDLFEKFEDIDNHNIWLDAGSEDPVQQMKNRLMVAEIADWIIPGHGPKFRVTEEIRKTLKKQADDTTKFLKGDS